MSRTPRRPMRAHLTILVILALLAMTLPATAEHPQVGDVRTVSFEHMAGNEWWVEVVLEGRDAASVARVEAQDTAGDWFALSFKSWGVWAGSFRIEPGHDVRFRAVWSDDETVTSCWFTHPTGNERCDARAETAAAFDATFSGAKGNDWWVEVFVSANEPLAGVDARLGCEGDWRALTKRSWGGWAESFFVAPGTVVDFRARSTTGAVDLSVGHVWPGGTPTDPCPAETPDPPAGGFLAEFDGVAGNDWWVQVFMETNEPLASVDARVGCSGDWRPLTLRSWGGWAQSFFVPPGSTVDFRARSTDGDETVSGGYVWPSAAPTAPCAVDAPEVAFQNVRGNQWWIETDVVGTTTLEKVEVRINGGDWLVLSPTDWGSWARAENTADPARVEFRATTLDGAVTTSHRAWWWGAAPSADPSAEGRTFVAYAESAGDRSHVKVNTFSVEPLLGVSYRVDGGDPQRMEQNDDGDWEATLVAPMPTGAKVTFLAFHRDAATGAVVVDDSGLNAWPPWPQPGGTAEYLFRHGSEAGDVRSTSEGTFRSTFRPGGAGADIHGTWIGTWEGTCTQRVARFDPQTDTWPETEETVQRTAAAPNGPVDTEPGQLADVLIGSRCEAAILRSVVEERMPYETAIQRADGTHVSLTTWLGTEAQPDADFEVLWDTETGLVTAWHAVERRPDGGVRNSGELIAASVFEDH